MEKNNDLLYRNLKEVSTEKGMLLFSITCLVLKMCSLSVANKNILFSLALIFRHLCACSQGCAAPRRSRRAGQQGSFYLLLFQVLCNSKNSIMRDCFLLSELDNRRRPETVSSVFSLNSEYQGYQTLPWQGLHWVISRGPFPIN